MTRFFFFSILLTMLIIRLQRVGRKNDPNFRLIATEKTRAPKSGAYLEMLGYYNPKTKKIELKNDRIKHWLLKGAQLSATAHNMLVKAKIIEAPKINVVKAAKPLTTPIKGV